MLKYENTTEEQKREIYDKAFTYRHNHADYVANLTKEKGLAIAPSGSDMFKPELWKEIHWRWFYQINHDNY